MEDTKLSALSKFVAEREGPTRKVSCDLLTKVTGSLAVWVPLSLPHS